MNEIKIESIELTENFLVKLNENKFNYKKDLIVRDLAIIQKEIEYIVNNYDLLDNHHILDKYFESIFLIIEICEVYDLSCVFINVGAKIEKNNRNNNNKFFDIPLNCLRDYFFHTVSRDLTDIQKIKELLIAIQGLINIFLSHNKINIDVSENLILQEIALNKIRELIIKKRISVIINKKNKLDKILSVFKSTANNPKIGELIKNENHQSKMSFFNAILKYFFMNVGKGCQKSPINLYNSLHLEKLMLDELFVKIFNKNAISFIDNNVNLIDKLYNHIVFQPNKSKNSNRKAFIIATSLINIKGRYCDYFLTVAPNNLKEYAVDKYGNILKSVSLIKNAEGFIKVLPIFRHGFNSYLDHIGITSNVSYAINLFNKDLPLNEIYKMSYNFNYLLNEIQSYLHNFVNCIDFLQLNNMPDHEFNRHIYEIIHILTFQMHNIASFLNDKKEIKLISNYYFSIIGLIMKINNDLKCNQTSTIMNLVRSQPFQSIIQPHIVGQWLESSDNSFINHIKTQGIKLYSNAYALDPCSKAIWINNSVVSFINSGDMSSKVDRDKAKAETVLYPNGTIGDKKTFLITKLVDNNDDQVGLGVKVYEKESFTCSLHENNEKLVDITIDIPSEEKANNNSPIVKVGLNLLFKGTSCADLMSDMIVNDFNKRNNLNR